jgi:hypothetical protein
MTNGQNGCGCSDDRSNSGRSKSDLSSKSSCKDDCKEDCCELAQKKFDLANFISYVSQDNIYWSTSPLPGSGGNTGTLPMGVQVVDPNTNYYYPGASGVYFYTIDPCVDLCALEAATMVTLNRALRTPIGNVVPKVKNVEFLSDNSLIDVIEFLVDKINSLCIPACAKAKIVDQIVKAEQDLVSDANFTDGKMINSFCGKSGLPKCGPLYIRNVVKLEHCRDITEDSHDLKHNNILTLLLRAKYLLRIYFSTTCTCGHNSHDRDCDCDLTFDKACKLVFGRFCILKVLDQDLN